MWWKLQASYGKFTCFMEDFQSSLNVHHGWTPFVDDELNGDGCEH